MAFEPSSTVVFKGRHFLLYTCPVLPATLYPDQLQRSHALAMQYTPDPNSMDSLRRGSGGYGCLAIMMRTQPKVHARFQRCVPGHSALCASAFCLWLSKPSYMIPPALRSLIIPPSFCINFKMCHCVPAAPAKAHNLYVRVLFHKDNQKEQRACAGGFC